MLRLFKIESLQLKLFKNIFWIVSDYLDPRDVLDARLQYQLQNWLWELEIWCSTYIASHVLYAALRSQRVTHLALETLQFIAGKLLWIYGSGYVSKRRTYRVAWWQVCWLPFVCLSAVALLQSLALNGSRWATSLTDASVIFSADTGLKRDKWIIKRNCHSAIKIRVRFVSFKSNALPITIQSKETLLDRSSQSFKVSTVANWIS